MSRLARAVFAALVVATFGAFFVAQRLKNTPTVIQKFKLTPLFSPNGDGRFERAVVTFLVPERDEATVEVVTADGDRVRTLADAQTMQPYRALRVVWDGRDDADRAVPDGLYRTRITLRRAGRAVVVPRSVVKDTRPPRPRVVSIGPARAVAPEILPSASGGPARIRLDAPGRRVRVSIFRTDGERPDRVAGSGMRLADGATRWEWDGTRDGRRVRPGTYLAVVESRDRAGNIGFSAPMRDGLPLLEPGRKLPGRAGITVRYLGVAPPAVPIIAGEPADVFIDARGEPWRYTLRRVGGPAAPIRRSVGSGTRARLRLRMPERTGVYLLTVRTRDRMQRVPITVQESIPEGRVLVVLPWVTWQGRNAVDDDGDGRANTLEAGVGVRALRVFAGDGLPVGFAAGEAPVLGFLDRTRRDYDLTTDLALARGEGPRLDEFRGVLLPGDTRWLPAELGAQLRRFARDGGTVVSLGTESLRRQVDVTPRRLVRPTTATRADLFGARISDVQRRATELTVLDDEIDLFAGDEGLFPDVEAFEETLAAGDASELVAAAVTPEGRPVIAAARFGKGLVVRTGLPDFATRLTPRPESAALMNRLWVLLSRGEEPR